MTTRREMLIGGAAALAVPFIGKGAPIKSVLGADKAKWTEGEAPITARSYIQDGLVEHWDGIENVEYGVHNPYATTWVSLITGNYFPIAASYQDSVSFTRSNDVRIYGGNLEVKYTADHDLTLHTVVTAPDTINYMVQAMVALGRDSFNKNGFVIGCLSGYSTVVAYWGSAYSGATRYIVDTGKGVATQFAVDIVFDYANLQFKVYVDGVQVGTTQTIDSSVWNLNGVTTLRLGMGANSGALNDATGFRQHGIMVYDCQLAPDEIAYNYAVDKVRFNLP